MSNAPYLELKSPILGIERRDFYMADATLLSPTNANPLLDGEWLNLDANYKLVRTSGNVGIPSFQVFAEKGRYDTQPIGKVPVLFNGAYEAETQIYTSTGLAVNDELIVADVTFQSLTRKGLIKRPAGAGTYMVVGWVTKLLTSKLRFMKAASPFIRVI